MEYCINNPGEISKIHRVKAKVDEVKGIMVQNIEKVGMLITAWQQVHIPAVTQSDQRRHYRRSVHQWVPVELHFNRSNASVHGLIMITRQPMQLGGDQHLP